MGENQWQEMPTPLNNSQIDVGMSIDGATGALYVTVNDMTTNPTQGHWQVWRSPNPAVEMNNVKWEKVYDFPNNRWATMLASGGSPQGLALYVRVRLPTQEQALMRSLDGGKTWNAIKIP